jgi:hypothetical protein
MNANRPDFLAKQLDIRSYSGGFPERLRYLDAYRQGATAGRLAAINFANKKNTRPGTAAFPLRD